MCPCLYKSTYVLTLSYNDYRNVSICSLCKLDIYVKSPSLLYGNQILVVRSIKTDQGLVLTWGGGFTVEVISVKTGVGKVRREPPGSRVDF